MKNVERKSVLSTIFFAVGVICISILSSVLICFIVFSPTNDVMPIKINIWGQNMSAEAKEEINKSINSNVESLYEKSISKLDVSITLFSCALGIFTIVFGFFYFLKIRESEKLMDEIQNKTSEFFKRHYREQFDKAIAELFSANNIKRYNAIKNLSNNPEITPADFDLISAALTREFAYTRNSFIYGNINSIINILISIDNGKTMQILISFLKSNEYDHMSMYPLLQFIVVDESDYVQNFIRDSLKGDTVVGTQLLFALMQYSVIDGYVDFILENGADNVLQQLIAMSGNDVWKISFSLKPIIKRNTLAEGILATIIHNKAFTIQDKITVLIYFYSITNDDSYTNTLSSFIQTISDDENAKTDFIKSIKEYECEEKIRSFFQKNKHRWNYFKNISIAQDIMALLPNDDTIENDKINSLIMSRGIKIGPEGKIVDKNGKEYTPGNYTPTLMGWQKAIDCIEIDGEKIPVDNLKKS